MPLSSIRSCLVVLVGVIGAGTGFLPAQGVDLQEGAIVVSGSAANCTKPAMISYLDIRDATPEWQEIESEGVRKGSARYALLSSRMGQRIAAAAKAVARDLGHDLIVVEGGISDPRGLEVLDITDLVIDELQAIAPTP